MRRSIEHIQEVYSKEKLEIKSYIDNIEQEESYIIAILDEDGKEVLENTIAKENKSIYEDAKECFLENYDIKDITQISKYDHWDDILGTRVVIFLAPILKHNGNREFIFVMDEVRLPKDIRNTVQYFFLLIFFIIIIAIFIFSYLYSRIISKPLIEMDKVAKKMAALDFSQSLKEDSDDEIGSLARSLNTLSTNLEDSLEKLRLNNQRLKEFTANASHELKTPLAIIGGYIEGIKDGIYSEERDEYLDLIQIEISKMNKLVVDMLEIFKTESEGFSFNKEKFNIHKLTLDIITRFETSIDKKNIDFKKEFDEKEILVDADKKKIEVVVENLLSNAVRYTEENGRINVKIKLDSDRVFIAVENTSQHMSKEQMGKIWDRFYRLDKSRSKETGGTGLGLSIVRNILKSHDSEFGVRNTPIGIEFYFILNGYNTIDI
ncbi:HAMP domain-containing sensor histidine kinase [Wukongibacter baidiensis]|uniref:HAMP domain-containing sensor histidine kinase n=1 Tax=Wukongibacter baidiensis TaxID=1723361 RepID=UPI003D7F5FB8